MSCCGGAEETKGCDCSKTGNCNCSSKPGGCDCASKEGGCGCGPKAANGCGCAATGVCSCAGNCQCVSFGIRKPAPYFESGAWFNGMKTVKLTDFKGKYLVLFFYPLDFTFVCPTEIIQFSDRA